MRLRAFAKINLDLRILGKRPDGFHELRTVFQSIDWFDEIEINQASRFSFRASDGPQDETNLVVRAVRAFEGAAGRKVSVSIRLSKNVPSGAGLGGGSSDAAATFIGLQRLYSESLEPECIRTLGSDVTFFMFGGRALGTGRGDRIEELEDEAGYWLVLVKPRFSINTAEAYSWLTLADKSNRIEGFRVQSVSGSESAEQANDFEYPVFARYPQLRAIRDDLLRHGAFRAALSGSGSTVFGQFQAEHDAIRTSAALRGHYSVKVTRPLSRAEYLSKMFV
jgi:4-diphosphocytidyl-2-C-methyl-D-erythritol kinase